MAAQALGFVGRFAGFGKAHGTGYCNNERQHDLRTKSFGHSKELLYTKRKIRRARLESETQPEKLFHKRIQRKARCDAWEWVKSKKRGG
jgi:hypothetical protein